MSKLYCPKGHELAEPTQESLKEITVTFKNHHNQRCTQWLLFCKLCNRPYLGCDVSKKEQPDFGYVCGTHGCQNVNATNVVDIPKTESQIAVDRVVEALKVTIIDICKMGEQNNSKKKAKEFIAPLAMIEEALSKGNMIQDFELKYKEALKELSK